MKVEILHQGTVIGHGNLDPIDPPMGVAAGKFEPTSNYDPQLHASMIDLVYKDYVPLTARSDEFGVIDCQGVAIEDCSVSLRELQVTVLGIAYPAIRPFFRLILLTRPITANTAIRHS